MKRSLRRRMVDIGWTSISEELLAILRSEPKLVSDTDIANLTKLALKQLAAGAEEKLLVVNKAEQIEIDIASDKAARLNKTFREMVEKIYCRLRPQSKLAKILLAINTIHFINVNPQSLP